MRIESEELYVQIGLNPNLFIVSVSNRVWHNLVVLSLLPLLSLLSLFTFNSFIFIEN